MYVYNCGLEASFPELLKQYLIEISLAFCTVAAIRGYLTFFHAFRSVYIYFILYTYTHVCVYACLNAIYKPPNLSHLDVQSSAAYFMNMSRVLHINSRNILKSTGMLMVKNCYNNKFVCSLLLSTAVKAPRGHCSYRRVPCLFWLPHRWALRSVELSSTFLTFQYFMDKIHSIGILTFQLKHAHIQ